MTTFRQGDYDTRRAGADLRTSQYRVVKTDANGNYVLATAATDNIRGVLANAPNINEIADVANLNGAGSFKVVAGAAIPKDSFLTADSTGRAIAATQAAAGAQPTTRVFGRSRSAATAAGDVIEYDKLDWIL